MPKRTFVKLTFNPNDAFDREILEYLEGRRGKAGEVKKLAYNSILRMREATTKIKTFYEEPASQSASALEVETGSVKSEQAADEFGDRLGAILKF